jgi:phosphohistidine phosphatase
MKTLTLLRHAKSTWDDPVARDFDRPLNKRGRRAARTSGARCARRAWRFDRVIASPAVRVIETLAEVADGYGGARTRVRQAHLPRLARDPAGTGPGTDDGAERLLIVGHNPGLEMLALLLTRGEGLRAELALKYPTATIAEISLPVEHWSDVGEGAGTLERFIRPRDLDPELGPDEDTF